jgi:transmembrane protein EpsG
MAVLWMNLAVVYIFSLFSRYFAKPVSISSHFVKLHKLMAFFALLSLVVISGLRKDMADTYYYMYSYAHTDFTWENIMGRKDIGFNIFQMYLQKFSHNPQVLVFITALITNVLIVLILYKYSGLFELSLYVFITNGFYLTSMNGIRQFLAAAIAFAATKYIFDGNWKKYIVVILLAAQMHQTALILIPIYFLIRRKAWSWTTFLLLFLAILIVFGFNQFSSALFSVIDDTQYGDYKNAGYHGANVIRVVVEAAPILFAFLGRNRLRRIFPDSDYIVNMSVLGLVFMIIATQNWIFARFDIYFGLYSLILVSWIVQVFQAKDQKFIYYSILVCYFIFCYYQQVITFGTVYLSNYIQF